MGGCSNVGALEKYSAFGLGKRSSHKGDMNILCKSGVVRMNFAPIFKLLEIEEGRQFFEFLNMSKAT